MFFYMGGQKIQSCQYNMEFFEFYKLCFNVSNNKIKVMVVWVLYFLENIKN